ncbi:glycosyltransferase family 2 protein [Flavobacterium restrictum]|uniref:Glycosyltransferase family 2 protein n=1 Tax=Flavobacterium restrictum TaxID=2594428 RepID=A0A553EAU4_9FLAO|nr:glycosyltransferase [Flavobacterium restrictum]TRX42166.1 glycosyltransferase family 2 protein [Flavobacterium restrictum]
MLSILIPTYNYNAFPLVYELQQQCIGSKIEFEIRVQDDNSTAFLNENNAINTLENCSFEKNAVNLGRGKNCNALAEKARFDWLLLLDCDTFPKTDSFIKKYLLFIDHNAGKIAFGGIAYHSEKPASDQLLRWIYGTQREALPADYRNQKPNSRALTSNLLIQKTVFLQHPFDSQILKYGYEDLCFLSVLAAHKYRVSHLDNPTFHENLETSVVFLEKTKTALDNLAFITTWNTTLAEESKIVATYTFLTKVKLHKWVAFAFDTFESKIKQNLLSDAPKLFLFDCYKLGYFCKIKN